MRIEAATDHLADLVGASENAKPYHRMTKGRRADRANGFSKVSRTAKGRPVKLSGEPTLRSNVVCRITSRRAQGVGNRRSLQVLSDTLERA